MSRLNPIMFSRKIINFFTDSHCSGYNYLFHYQKPTLTVSTKLEHGESTVWYVSPLRVLSHDYSWSTHDTLMTDVIPIHNSLTKLTGTKHHT